jgi:hypothetical protein
MKKIAFILHSLIFSFLLGCVSDTAKFQSHTGDLANVERSNDADKFYTVDCLLPGQIRRLGREAVYQTARIPIKTSALDCEEQGGEYTPYQQANTTTALQYWLPAAQGGDAESQVYVGELFAKGKDTPADYKAAAEWYKKAAAQGNSRAQFNLGYLYENGLGVEKNLVAAVELYKKASGLYKEGLEYAITLTSSKTATQKPIIEVIDPPVVLARGTPVVRLGTAVKEMDIIGRVTDPAGIMSLTVNNVKNNIDPQGKFKSTIDIRSNDTPVSVVATNNNGMQESLNFMMTISGEAVNDGGITPFGTSSLWKDFEFGNYYALIIGNNDYQQLPDLDTPDDDAKAVNSVLKSKYGFNTQLLINANRYQILSALNELTSKVTENDNLLVYYAGHGELDQANDRGQWLPVDAERNNTANWISNIDITDILNRISAKHIIVLADSCYSGAMTSSALPRIDSAISQQKKIETVKVMINAKSRTALTSGGKEPVIDGGGGGHSIFAKAVIDTLQKNHGLLEAQQLYNVVSDIVIPVAKENGINQTPVYAPINMAGHAGGEFIFVAN